MKKFKMIELNGGEKYVVAFRKGIFWYFVKHYTHIDDTSYMLTILNKTHGEDSMKKAIEVVVNFFNTHKGGNSDPEKFKKRKTIGVWKNIDELRGDLESGVYD